MRVKDYQGAQELLRVMHMFTMDMKLCDSFMGIYQYMCQNL